jgi:hypothetical protein
MQKQCPTKELYLRRMISVIFPVRGVPVGSKPFENYLKYGCQLNFRCLKGHLHPGPCCEVVGG